MFHTIHTPPVNKSTDIQSFDLWVQLNPTNFTPDADPVPAVIRATIAASGVSKSTPSETTDSENEPDPGTVSGDGSETGNSDLTNLGVDLGIGGNGDGPATEVPPPEPPSEPAEEVIPPEVPEKEEEIEPPAPEPLAPEVPPETNPPNPGSEGDNGELPEENIINETVPGLRNLQAEEEEPAKPT